MYEFAITNKKSTSKSWPILLEKKQMYKEIKTFTNQALSCLKYANAFAIAQKKKTISGDELFLGIYNYLKQNDNFILLCSIIWLKDREAIENYFEQKYKKQTAHNQKTIINKKLWLNKKIRSMVQETTNDSGKQLDILILFYISFFDLSSQFEKHLYDHNIDRETIAKNCQNLIKNKAIYDMGLFAFLEILSKLLSKFNLHPENISIMKINDINNVDDMKMLLDAVENDTMDKNNESNIDTTTTDKKQKEDKKLTIEYFWTDLTKEYRDGFIDPIIWRDKEINQVIYTLLRKTKNNPLLIGEAWVGKTAIVEGLAQKIAQWNVPERLKNKKIFLLDMWTLVAGTKYRWEFEARMKSILEEAVDMTNNIILFIDEIHTIIGAGGQDNWDAAQMLKPLLSRGKIKLIGATTFDEYQKHIEKDAALKRRFQEVVVNEPSDEDTKAILQWLRKNYEDFHGVQILDESIDNAIKLSKRYMLNKHLPDKALDIIDEACARKSTLEQKLNNDEEYNKAQKKIEKIQLQIEKAIESQDYFGAAELKDKEEQVKQEMMVLRTHKNIPTHLRPIITTTDIGSILAEKIGIPANIVNETEIERLRRLSEDLQTHIMWQAEAVETIVKTLTRNRLSVIERNKPIGSFFFLGPSGVGKTYLAKLIAKNYFGDENAIIRLDMSEYMEKYSISKLIWSPAWYVGYDEWWQLTESIRRRPYSVLLLDEIEKASPDVLNILLQVLDEGKLKDSKGRIIDFKSTIIIMTSNIGSEQFSIKKTTIWFDAEEHKKWKEFDIQKERIFDELRNFLSPEFINRIDYKVVFKPLTKEILCKIMKKNLNEFLATWKETSEVKLPKYSDKQIKEIIEKIYDPQYWARPLERYISDEIEPKIINQLIK